MHSPKLCASLVPVEVRTRIRRAHAPHAFINEVDQAFASDIHHKIINQ